MLLNRTGGLSVGKNTIYNIQGYPLFGGAFANSIYMTEGFEKDLNQYRELGISGLQEEGAGSLLMTDYAPDNAISRADAMTSQRALLQRMTETFGSLRLSDCSAYALVDHAVMTELPGSSYMTMLDESVPFYPIALHGLVEYLCGDYMQFYEQKSQLLEAVARGGNVSFTLTWEGTEKLARADTAAYYSTEFSLWREDVLSVWRKLEPYLTATRGRYITGFERLADGVTVTTFENGVRVLVNNTDEARVIQGTAVDARDFCLAEGR